MEDYSNLRMPALFIGHGSPMNAIEKNPFTDSLSVLGNSFEIKPRAILVISAHWLTKGSYVFTRANPEQIYDFYGFPQALFEVKYPAIGSPDFAKKTIELSNDIKEDNSWGIDHGSWTVLKHLFPNADIPVFQLSIDFGKPLRYHFELGQKLASLRDQGVLIIGSGNIVHNLRMVYAQTAPYEWAAVFDEWVKNKIDKRDFNSLINYEAQGSEAKLAVPTTDHYIPLLYTLALAEKNENITYTYEEIQTSLSMRCFKIS
ncbi:MAG: 4,5-DOPA dioxygenase extradiol [Bacteroidota bacterium]|nr:4,5-DOPA dioxygenase extradiol [Bacteroidota bacterium]